MEEKIKKGITKRTQKKIIRLSTMLLVLIIALFIIWFLAVTFYKNKNEDKVADCLKEVLEGLKKELQEECQLEGKEVGENGLCPLSPEKAGKLYEKYENKKTECLKENPAK